MAHNTSADIVDFNGFPPTLLDRLPTELLDQTAESIDSYDLMSHINLCRVSQRACALYDRLNDEFWKLQCFMNGLGYVKSLDISPELVCWKMIAFKAVQHADKCDGVCCGHIQLEKNRQNMKMCLEDVPDLASNPRAMDEYLTDDMKSLRIAMFEFITFRPSYIVDSDQTQLAGFWRDRPYLESFRPSKIGTENKYEPLFDHPIAFRTFVVFPPIKTVPLLMQFHLPDISNEFGVTIADVCQTIMHEARDTLRASTIQRYFPRPDFSVPGWSFQDHIDDLAFGSLGGWFRALKCQGFRYDGDSDGDMFFFDFQPRELPKDFEEFADDIRAMARDDIDAFHLSNPQ